MAKKKAVKKGQKKTRTLTEKGKAAQEALQTTWLLKGSLKNAQLSYLRVGKLLAQVREKNMYASLGHADIEDYAEKRLQLGRSSLYKYLQVYDWTGKFHPEWLQPKPKGFIPDLNDISNVILIENDLARKNIDSAKKAALEDLKTRALDGSLRESELAALRRKGSKGADSLKSFLSKLRNIRMRASQLACMPPEVVTHLDAAIAILKNESMLAQCGIDTENTWQLTAMA